jgi:hypothetical protein
MFMRDPAADDAFVILTSGWEKSRFFIENRKIGFKKIKIRFFIDIKFVMFIQISGNLTEPSFKVSCIFLLM